MNVAAFDEKVVNNDDLKNMCQQAVWNDTRGWTYTTNWRDKNVVTSKESEEGGPIGFGEVSKSTHCSLKWMETYLEVSMELSPGKLSRRIIDHEQS